jgi:hypothetical protein
LVLKRIEEGLVNFALKEMGESRREEVDRPVEIYAKFELKFSIKFSTNVHTFLMYLKWYCSYFKFHPLFFLLHKSYNHFCLVAALSLFLYTFLVESILGVTLHGELNSDIYFYSYTARNSVNANTQNKATPSCTCLLLHSNTGNVSVMYFVTRHCSEELFYGNLKRMSNKKIGILGDKWLPYQNWDKGTLECINL